MPRLLVLPLVLVALAAALVMLLSGSAPAPEADTRPPVPILAASTPAPAATASPGDRQSLACPKCSSRSLNPIAYGLPSRFPDDDLITLGGCTIAEGFSPLWACRSCHHRWGVYDDGATSDMRLHAAFLEARWKEAARRERAGAR